MVRPRPENVRSGPWPSEAKREPPSVLELKTRPRSESGPVKPARSRSRTSPLSIAVVGPGGIGSTFAYYLAQTGHDVTVVARPGSPRLKRLQQDGGVIRTSGDRSAMRVLPQLDENAPYDLVIVTTPVHQLEPLIEPLKRSRAACIHFMFNVFDPEALRQRMAGQPCTFGMPFVMGSLDQAGRLDARISKSRKTLHSDQRWVDLFADAGVPSAFEPDMASWLRSHVPMCIAMESISVAAQQRGKGASWREARTVASGLRAGFNIITGLGYRLHPSKTRLSQTPVAFLSVMLWSVSRVASFRNLLATGVQECVDLIETVVTAARSKPALGAEVATLQAMSPKGRERLGGGGASGRSPVRLP